MVIRLVVFACLLMVVCQDLLPKDAATLARNMDFGTLSRFFPFLLCPSVARVVHCYFMPSKQVLKGCRWFSKTATRLGAGVSNMLPDCDGR